MLHRQIWDGFCHEQKIYESSVPLFATDCDLRVQTKIIGKTQVKTLLARSQAMESMVLEQVDILLADLEQGTYMYDGLIYVMFFKEAGRVVPLYIGKTESIGRKNAVSANIRGLRGDKGKFARWGDGYQYHIGDLSAVVLPSHSDAAISNKYISWAESLFVSYPSVEPKLKKEVFFWCSAWSNTSLGIWRDFGATRLTFLEYLMIGVASAAFPMTLLNREGHSRVSSVSVEESAA